MCRSFYFALDIMMAVACAPVGVATAVTTMSSSSPVRRRAAFGHCLGRADIVDNFQSQLTGLLWENRVVGGNVDPRRWKRIQVH